MTLVVDTNIVLALYDRRDAEHERVAAWYGDLDEDLSTSPLAVAEMDYLVTQRAGREVATGFWNDLDAGALQVRWWSTAMVETLSIARARPALGLTDASLIALAPIVRTDRIATLDHKHFSAARTADGDPFVLLP